MADHIKRLNATDAGEGKLEAIIRPEAYQCDGIIRLAQTGSAVCRASAFVNPLVRRTYENLIRRPVSLFRRDFLHSAPYKLRRIFRIERSPISGRFPS